MINVLFSRLCILACGTLYPAYISFKTVRAKIVEDYVKWMMYWIVFAVFTVTECFTDVFLTWFPFYYEAKVALILWLLPTMGNGYSFVYKKCIQPLLKKHETRVDHHLAEVRVRGQELVLQYIKETLMYIAQSVIDVINRNFPNGMLGILANTINTSNNVTPLPVSSSSIIAEEIQEEQNIAQTILSKTKNRKPIVKASAKTTDDGDAPQTSHGRARKTRNSKFNVNLNEN